MDEIISTESNKEFENVQTNLKIDYFDKVIGYIEDIIMEDEFPDLQKNFLENNWHHFENTEENKLIYMDIFRNYTSTIESFIVNQLNIRMGTFDMDKFAKDLQNKRPHLDGEIFDLLLSLLDFVVFKDLIMDYKAEKEGKTNDLALGITVTRIVEK